MCPSSLPDWSSLIPSCHCISSHILQSILFAITWHLVLCFQFIVLYGVVLLVIFYGMLFIAILLTLALHIYLRSLTLHLPRRLGGIPSLCFSGLIYDPGM